MKRPSTASENEANEAIKKTKASLQLAPIDIDLLSPEKKLSLKVRQKKQLVRVSLSHFKPVPAKLFLLA